MWQGGVDSAWVTKNPGDEYRLGTHSLPMRGTTPVTGAMLRSLYCNYWLRSALPYYLAIGLTLPPIR